jgi:hypothetical protein
VHDVALHGLDMAAWAEANEFDPKAAPGYISAALNRLVELYREAVEHQRVHSVMVVERPPAWPAAPTRAAHLYPPAGCASPRPAGQIRQTGGDRRTGCVSMAGSRRKRQRARQAFIWGSNLRDDRDISGWYCRTGR